MVPAMPQKRDTRQPNIASKAAVILCTLGMAEIPDTKVLIAILISSPRAFLVFPTPRYATILIAVFEIVEQRRT